MIVLRFEQIMPHATTPPPTAPSTQGSRPTDLGSQIATISELLQIGRIDGTSAGNLIQFRSNSAGMTPARVLTLWREVENLCATSSQAGEATLNDRSGRDLNVVHD